MAVEVPLDILILVTVFVLVFNNGFTIQKGTFSSNETYANIIFPTTFSHTNFIIIVLDYNTSWTTEVPTVRTFCEAYTQRKTSGTRILCTLGDMGAVEYIVIGRN